MTPMELEELAVQRLADEQIQRWREVLLGEKLELEAKLTASVREQKRLERKREEVEKAQQAQVEEQLSRLNVKEEQAAKRRDKQRDSAWEEARLVVRDIEDLVDEVAAKTLALQQELGEQDRILGSLPTKVDPDELSTDELVALLGTCTCGVASILPFAHWRLSHHDREAGCFSYAPSLQRHVRPHRHRILTAIPLCDPH